MINICNSLALVLTGVVHWIFAFRYWMVARKIKQIGIFSVTDKEAFKIRFIGWIGIGFNVFFALWYANYLRLVNHCAC